MNLNSLDCDFERYLIYIAIYDEFALWCGCSLDAYRQGLLTDIRCKVGNSRVNSLDILNLDLNRIGNLQARILTDVLDTIYQFTSNALSLQHSSDSPQ